MDKKKILERLQTPKAVRWFWIILCAPVALILLLLLLTRLGAFGKLPTFEELENPKSNLATEIYSDDGEMIGSFFIQNRSYVDYNELSPALVAALISTEDMRFYSHSGIDFISLARVAVKTLALGNRRQGGGSTITQQLAKNLYPRDTAVYNNPISKGSKLVISKLKEWITAVMLEYNYTKEEIITMYLNTVPYGSNAYGIKSAARTFFNKLPSELNVQEAAMLVGVVNAPTRYSPRSNPDRALARRNTVISRMREKGYLTRAQRDSIQALPIELDFRPISHNAGTGTYFREMLRMVMTSGKPSRESFGPGAAGDWDYRQAVEQWESNPLYGWCDKNVKANGQPYDLYRDGLKIYTTVNATMQRYAEQAVWEQMGETVQPMMDRVTKARGSVFSDISKDEREAIMRRAKKNSDRYRRRDRQGVRYARADARVQLQGRPRYGDVSRRFADVLQEVSAGFVHGGRSVERLREGLCRRNVLPLFQIRHGQAGPASGRLDDQAAALLHRSAAGVIPLFDLSFHRDPVSDLPKRFLRPDQLPQRLSGKGNLNDQRDRRIR